MREGLLRCVLDRIIPADASPGALEAGTDRFVARLLTGSLRQSVAAGLDALYERALAANGTSFEDLPASAQDELLESVAHAAWFRELAEVVAQGFYADPANGGNRDQASWRMIGYDARLPNRQPDRTPAPSGAASGRYDAVIIGAGVGGGIAASVLAEAGLRVLLLERGLARSYADSGQRDHLRNHRTLLLGHNTGPDLEGYPRVLVDPDGLEHVVPPHDPRYHNNAMCVGGGSFLYGGMAWRFLPDDFRMASRYGVPDGSSLVDWPFGYDELAPWYERAEWEIGVAGRSDAAPWRTLRRKPYPMPPVPAYAKAEALARGADALGWRTFRPPLLINTVARAGRAACIECGSCVGFPCPSDGKNGTQNTAVPRALATGRCDLVTGAIVTRILTDSEGRAEGVTFIRNGAEEVVRTGATVVACGAIETARLLLLSGIGNAHDQVGRNLQGHIYGITYGQFAHDIYDPRGPGVTIATCDFNHGNPGITGGGMLADDFIMLPVAFWTLALPPTVRRWGLEAKTFMRDNYRRVMQVRGPVHEIPNPECRVMLDPVVRDRFGLPVARLSGAVHPETLRTAGFIQEKAKTWLEASGAVATWPGPLVSRLSGGQHQAGTCRMGRDPATSVTDEWGRVWGAGNLVVTDGSLHPTNGGFNPVLTIMALAFRNADRLARALT